jgi:F-type H+-transporting ATPase subunit epsilon
MTNQLHCVVVTPERKAIEQAVDFVALPLYDGEIGIARDHAPLIGRMGFGEMRLRQGGQVTRYYVDGGFVHVAENQVTVLTSDVVPVDEIDETSAREQLDRAFKQPITTPQQEQIRDRALAQARAQLRVARK